MSLSTANLPLKKNLSRKLSPKYIGTFPVAEKSALGLSFKRDLPTELGRIHPAIHIFRLKPYYNSRKKEILETYIPFDLQLEHKPVEKVLA